MVISHNGVCTWRSDAQGHTQGMTALTESRGPGPLGGPKKGPGGQRGGLGAYRSKTKEKRKGKRKEKGIRKKKKHFLRKERGLTGGPPFLGAPLHITKIMPSAQLCVLAYWPALLWRYDQFFAYQTDQPKPTRPIAIIVNFCAFVLFWWNFICRLLLA